MIIVLVRRSMTKMGNNPSAQQFGLKIKNKEAGGSLVFEAQLVEKERDWKR